MSQKQAFSAKRAPTEASSVGKLAPVRGPSGVVAQAKSAHRLVDVPVGERGGRATSNGNGLPLALAAGIEALSGIDLSDVRVHMNSGKPARLNALAYAQGTEIHLGPGQHRHLAHEAWHVVQQRQGRVRATARTAGVSVNEEGALEREADVMGGRALQAPAPSGPRDASGAMSRHPAAFVAADGPAQLMKHVRGPTGKVEVVGDDYVPKWGERFVAAPAPPVPVAQAPQPLQALPQPLQAPPQPLPAPDAQAQEAARVAAEAEAARVAAEAEAAQEAARVAAAQRALQARREREARLAHYPPVVTRSDGNFAATENRYGQGKAHLLDTGLAPAGSKQIRMMDQLVQDSPDKGSSNLISFTGPYPQDPVAYGGRGAPSLRVKARKIMRARAKGKADAQHLEVHTSDALLGHIDGARQPPLPKRVLRRFVNKDDEHQVRVRSSRTHAAVIPPRFLYGAGLPDMHDSDSDEDS